MSNLKLVSSGADAFDIKLDEGYDSSSWAGSSKIASQSSSEYDHAEIGDFNPAEIWHEESASSAIVKKPKKKRKRPYYIPVNKLPRILKRDIRRDYPSMYVNVLNSLDVDLMNQFLEQFSIPSLKFSRYLPLAHRHNVPVSRSMNGVYSIAAGIHEEIKDFPDFMLQIQDVKIYQKQNVSGCKIIVQSLMKGTMLIYAQTLAKVVAAAATAAEAQSTKRNRKKLIPPPTAFNGSESFHPSVPNMSQLASLAALPANSPLPNLPTLLENLANSPVVSNFMAMFSSNPSPTSSSSPSSPIVPIYHNVVTQTVFSVDDESKIYQIDVTDQILPIEELSSHAAISAT